LVGSRVQYTKTGNTYTVNATDGATNGMVVEPLDLSQPANAGKVAVSFRNSVIYNN
jgi:hypothetical protein